MKRYEVRGMMEWHPEFRVGRGRLKVAFTGGHLSAGGCTPASFETADPVVQAVIESSVAFARGLITEGGRSAAGLAPEGARQVAPSDAAVRMTALHEPATAMVFESLGEAQDYLQLTKGVSIDTMIDAGTCIAKAAQLGMKLKIKESGAQ